MVLDYRLQGILSIIFDKFGEITAFFYYKTLVFRFTQIHGSKYIGCVYQKQKPHFSVLSEK